MKTILLTIGDNPNAPGWLEHKRSLDHFGYEYEFITAPFEFGHQFPIILDWCEKNQDKYNNILYCDAYDCFALAPMREVEAAFFNYTSKKMVVSSDRLCWPNDTFKDEFPNVPHPWRYICAGTFIFNIQWFMRMCHEFELGHEMNDQEWLARTYLKNKGYMHIDDCEIFQTLIHADKGDFEYRDGRLYNTITGTKPLIIHGNGHSDMSSVYQLL